VLLDGVVEQATMDDLRLTSEKLKKHCFTTLNVRYEFKHRLTESGVYKTCCFVHLWPVKQ